MKLKVIACNVFFREICHAAARTPHTLDLEFIELGEHLKPSRLRQQLQAAIDRSTDFDAVVLAYGLCGRSTDGLSAGAIPLVLPRSHDCCGILLGSRKRFEEIFSPMPSTPFSSTGYIERGNYYFADGEMMLGDSYEALIETYGEEDARYIYEAMHPKLDGELQPIYFIDIPGIPSEAAKAKCRAKAEEEKRPFREIPGSLNLIEKLLFADWNPEEFLTVPPGANIKMVGDWNEIIRLAPPEK